MVDQARRFQELVGERLVLKICISREGLAAMQTLRGEGIPVAMTAVASVMQADIAAQAGADYLALYMGRADRFGSSGADLIGRVVELVKIHGYPSRVVAASIQHPLHFEEAAERGAHYAASPIGPIEQAMNHPITETSIAGFLADWKSISE
jgi:transaldolase